MKFKLPIAIALVASIVGLSAVSLIPIEQGTLVACSTSNDPPPTKKSGGKG
jgi:hypothetical protein